MSKCYHNRFVMFSLFSELSIENIVMPAAWTGKQREDILFGKFTSSDDEIHLLYPIYMIIVLCP
jgi:hypothetical protein